MGEERVRSEERLLKERWLGDITKKKAQKNITGKRRVMIRQEL